MESRGPIIRRELVLPRSERATTLRAHSRCRSRSKKTSTSCVLEKRARSTSSAFEVIAFVILLTWQPAASAASSEQKSLHESKGVGGRWRTSVELQRRYQNCTPTRLESSWTIAKNRRFHCIMS